jgi:GT2 family glycosyltransferase
MVRKRALSIVIPAFNEALDLPKCLASLAPLIASGDAQVIVVDNGSTDETSAIAVRGGVEVHKVARTTVGAARNAGVTLSEGRILSFLDGDIVVTEHWIASMRELIQLPDWKGEITGDVVDVSTEPTWLERHWFGAIYRRGARHHLNSGNLVISREDFVRIGGFDASLMSGEDAELCQRALGRGIRLAPRRGLHVHHLGFPRTLVQFVNRETWHGRGDFVTLATVRASPVALATLAFVALHGFVLAAIVAGQATLAAAGLAALAGLCLACSFWKFSLAPVASRLVNAVIYYQVRIETLVTSDHLTGGEMCCVAGLCGRAESPGVGMVIQQTLQSLGERMRTSRRHQQAGLLVQYRVFVLANTRHDHRLRMRHGLEHDNRHGFPQG